MMRSIRQAKRKRVEVDKPGLAFTLEERWDLKMVEYILGRRSSLLDENGEFDYTAEKVLQSVYLEKEQSKQSKQISTLTVQYYLPANCIPYCINGRVFGRGLQTVPKWVRRLCSHKYYYDVDIVNCYPVILLQLYRQVGVDIEAHCLEQYVRDREEVLANDMSLTAGLTRKDAKEQYLKVMFGATELDYETPFLLRYKEEIEYITEHLWHMAQYQSIRNSALSHRATQPNVKGSFLSTVINTVERRIVEIAMNRFKEEDLGYQVDVYVFDGFMVRKKRNLESIPLEHLEELENTVERETGYKIKFIEKSLTPEVEDLEHLYHPFNNTISGSMWTARKVFLELGILASELNQEPKPENVAEFQKACIPMMNQAFAKVKGTISLVAIRDVGATSNDIEYTRCKQEEVKRNYSSEVYLIDTGEEKKAVIPIKDWINSKYALSYDKMCFNPRPYTMANCCSPFELNTFVGIAYPPTEKLSPEQCTALEQNQLKPFWEHVRRIWCTGNDELFQYVKNWIWSKVTRPWYRVECALVMQSDQGAGKGIIVEKVAEVMGERYMSKPSSLEQITGNTFNRQYFDNCLLMFLDEAFYAGSKATKNQVKTLITDSKIYVNEKFMPTFVVENFMSMILASNEDHVVNREVKARRYLNMALSNELSGNHADGSSNQQYFDAIYAVDPQLLSNYLHSIPAPQWTGRDIPKTLEGEEQAIMSFGNLEQFVHSVMIDPTSIFECRIEYQKIRPSERETFIFPDEEDLDLLAGGYVKKSLYDFYTRNFRSGFQSSQKQLMDYLVKFIPSVQIGREHRRKDYTGKQQYLVIFPTIEVARREYKHKKGLIHTEFN